MWILSVLFISLNYVESFVCGWVYCASFKNNGCEFVSQAYHILKKYLWLWRLRRGHCMYMISYDLVIRLIRNFEETKYLVFMVNTWSKAGIYKQRDLLWFCLTYYIKRRSTWYIVLHDNKFNRDHSHHATLFASDQSMQQLSFDPSVYTNTSSNDLLKKKILKLFWLKTSWGYWLTQRSSTFRISKLHKKLQVS